MVIVECTMGKFRVSIERQKDAEKAMESLYLIDFVKVFCKEILKKKSKTHFFVLC